MVNQMTRRLWQRSARKMPRLIGAKLLRIGRDVDFCEAWNLRRIIINGIYGVLLLGSPSISTLAWISVSYEQLQAETRMCRTER